ncbi:MAG: exodeoxyribonuclease III [Elusimicrobia bacterium]|nr:exodeoxyribonuclease III [Elusimicrobiota bacterium]
MKIATFNANSIRVRLPIVLDWLAKETPDVLALQETKVTDADFPYQAFENAGWRVVFRGQKSYNGVAFVSKQPLEDVVSRMAPGLGADEEARYLSARLGNLFLVNTYVPQGYMADAPQFQKKLKFFGELGVLFAREVRPDQPALWMGDLNVAPTAIDLWDPIRNAQHVCFHPLARKAFEETRNSRWVDLFREKEKGPGHYTFWDYLMPTNLEKNRGWRIDHILGTPPMAARLTRIWIDKEPRLKPKPSDHTFLAAEFERE